MKFPEHFRVQMETRPSRPGDPFGCFIVPGHRAPRRRQLNIIACDAEGTGWDHVSVSIDNAPKQTPVWAEMCFIKDLFWAPDEWVIQFHPAKADYVNLHEGVLHLWKPANGISFPTPPKLCV